MRRALSPFLLAFVLLALFVELAFRLQFFPGLHGDEAWVGLRALDIIKNGSSSIHGMNTYSGALFPHIVAASFWIFGVNVFSLRLATVLLNIIAIGVLTVTFWERPRAPIYIVLLFASSLLFLFYSRVAWEVTAFENLLISLIMASTLCVLTNAKMQKSPAALFFTTFTIGTFNHFIFAAAALSFVVTAGFIASKTVNSRTSRLFLMGLCNLPLQFLVMVTKPLVLDGPFATHGLPALTVGSVLVVSTTLAFIRTEPFVLSYAKRLYWERPSISARIHKCLFYGIAVCLLIVLPFNGLSFLGMISGIIEMARIVSYVPSHLESALLYLRSGVLLFAFGWLSYRHNIGKFNDPEDVIKGFMLVWPIVFLIAMQVETLGLSDRYFIIPQAMFFAALALCVDELAISGRLVVLAAIAVGLVQTQLFYWQEILRSSPRKPFDFQYGFYFDTSRHFTKLEEMDRFLRSKAICRVESSSYFISKPINFLLSAPSCPKEKSLDVEYCDTCEKPVKWFKVSPLKEGGPR